MSPYLRPECRIRRNRADLVTHLFLFSYKIITKEFHLYELIIEVEKTPSGVTVIRLRGPLTMKDLFEFQESARPEAAGSVVIDLTEVPYIDSAGLGAMLGVMASCERNGRRFGIIGACDRVRTLFHITHVDTLIPSFDNVAAAAAQFAGR